MALTEDDLAEARVQALTRDPRLWVLSADTHDGCEVTVHTSFIGAARQARLHAVECFRNHSEEFQGADRAELERMHAATMAQIGAWTDPPPKMPDAPSFRYLHQHARFGGIPDRDEGTIYYGKLALHWAVVAG